MKEKENKLTGYCQFCQTLPVDSRPKGPECHSCGKFACDSHGRYVSWNWYCNSCAPVSKEASS